MNNKPRINIGNTFLSERLDCCDVVIYDNDDILPHFHIVCGGFECCICIYKPMYFSHTDEIKSLNDEEVLALIEWMDEPHKLSKYNTSNWYTISSMWCISNNSDDNVPEVISRPDYKLLLNSQIKF